MQVYPDVGLAQRGSQRLVEGYCCSTWIDNLALFEANADEDQQLQTAALERSASMQSATDVSTASAGVERVDKDYTNLVLDALASNPHTAIAAPDDTSFCARRMYALCLFGRQPEPDTEGANNLRSPEECGK